MTVGAVLDNGKEEAHLEEEGLFEDVLEENNKERLTGGVDSSRVLVGSRKTTWEGENILKILVVISDED